MKSQRIIMVVLLLLSGCKGNSEKTQAGETQESAARKTNRDSSDGIEEDANKSVEKILLLATVAKQDEAPMSLDVTLDRAESGRVFGRTTLDGQTLKLSGTFNDEQLRVWVQGGEGEKTRRGYLIGALSSKGGEGTVAISGSGGIPNYKGEWKRR